MNEKITLSIKQVDTVTLSLTRAHSLSQLLLLCGPEQRPEPLDHESLFVVMQILSEELEKIEKVMEEAKGDPAR